MLENLPALRRLVSNLQKLPYLASRNVYRIAVHLLSCNQKDIESLLGALEHARSEIKRCKECFSWSQGAGKCFVCSNHSRDRSIICVVETWYDLCSIERAGDFRGLYHVLGGCLCPMEGVGPEHLTIEQLAFRLNNKEVKEVILATNPTPEGEATASLIASKVDPASGIKISRLASGVPMGGSLEFMDGMTIHKAISGRQPF
ncbi:recombination protein RecR [Candidatus Babeliales bacterium]|nr:recombination protein RecR [Candidatus Babeliales bacterium]